MDLLPTPDLLALLLDHQVQAMAAVERALPHIAAAIEATVPRLRTGGRLHYAGAGTSGRLALLDAAECPPTFGVPPDLMRAHLASGGAAFAQPHESAEDDREAGARAIAAAGARSGDVVAGLDPAQATALLERCDHEARVAPLCARLDLAPEAAHDRLADAAGDVRRALGER